MQATGIFGGAGALALLGLLSGGAPVRALAQNTAEPEALALEEIVVTARRREENIQTVPIAITAVSQQQLLENNVRTLADLQHLIPSMSATSSFVNRDSVNISIRGQGVNSVNGKAGVVAYLNEVPIATTGSFDQLAGGPGLLFDLENVQALKGPQGTLFGRNSVGGALLLQSARPTNEYGGRIELGYGNFDDREIDAALNLPLVQDKLLARIAFNGVRRDGFTRLQGSLSHPDGVDVDDRDYWSVRGTLSFMPSERIRNDAILTYQDYTSHGSPRSLTAVNPDPFNGCPGGPAGSLCLVPLIFPTFASLVAQQIALGHRTFLPMSGDPDSRGTLLALNNLTSFDISDALKLRNIFGYQVARSFALDDPDATVLPIFGTIRPTDFAKRVQYTDELQLLGKSFNDRLDWILGAFYLESRNPEYLLTTTLTLGAPTDSEVRDTTRSKAVFAQGTYDLSSWAEGLSVTTGLRYTRDTVNRNTRRGPLGDECCLIQLEDESKALTWTVGLDYRATPDTLLYLASRRGYRPGGSNATSLNPTLPKYSPEYVKDIEFGIKSDWGTASLPVRSNLAVYYQDYTNIQVPQLTFSSAGFTTVTGNGAAARVYGAELELSARLTRNLELGTSFDYLKFDFRKIASDVQGVAQLEASRTHNRPPYKYGVNVRYHVPVAAEAGDLSLLAHWSWQDTSGDAGLRVGGLIPSFGLLNLSADWNGIGGGALDASLFVSNALNKDYRAGGLAFFDLLGYDLYRFGEPRMYGVRLGYRFGAH